MKIIDVPARGALRWIGDAFMLFRAQPLGWIALVSTWFVLWFLLAASAPILGAAVARLLAPAFFAGLMLACRDQTLGKAVTVRHLFAAFKVNARSLLTFGAIMLLVDTVLILLLYSVGFPDKIPVTSDNRIDLAALKILLNDKAWPITLGFVLSSAVMAIFWFAAPLLVLRPMPVSHAIRWALYASFSNILPLTLFALIMMLLSVLATIPWALGFVVLVPVFMIANYTSYVSVFAEDERSVSPTPSESGRIE
jgi:uncharacterized membrane protein